MRKREAIVILLSLVFLLGFSNQEAKALVDAQIFVTIDILNSPVPGGTIDAKFTYVLKNIGDVAINQFNITFPVSIDPSKNIFGSATFSSITGLSGWTPVGTLPPQFQFAHATGIAPGASSTFSVTVTGADFDAWKIDANWSGGHVGSQSFAVTHYTGGFPPVELMSGHTVVPEPTTLTLLGLGLLGAGVARKIRHRRNNINKSLEH